MLDNTMVCEYIFKRGINKGLKCSDVYRYCKGEITHQRFRQRLIYSITPVFMRGNTRYKYVYYYVRGTPANETVHLQPKKPEKLNENVDS